MTYRRNRSPFSLFDPFAAYRETFLLGKQTSEMLISSAVVIFHRSNMINKALNGKLSWSDPEFSKLWQEKIAANMEAYSSLSRAITKSPLIHNNIFDGGLKNIKAITRSTRPYHSKAKANALRLSKKAVTKRS